MSTTRHPRTALEVIRANTRPQPAIPALLVLLLCGLFAGAAAEAGDSSLAAWAFTAGLLASWGLAVAAGFCSVFPTVAWIGVAWLVFGSALDRLPAHSRLALYAGVVAAAVMTLVQVWRVRTGRFVPTIADDPDEQDDAR